MSRDAVRAQEDDDVAARARHARFGSLPEPVRVEDLIEERPAVTPDPARFSYDPDEWLVRYCA
ncbi:hypothetical protein M4D73_27170 [Streptomyces pseudogriseolus]|uniref:hypothetical protein n=1 Tax=Streptomyces pseudogriseolus TaxID=36817 RepID=UPI003FA202C0|nr:hypothetical protein [Streptomyces pseudogriseolus]